MTRSLPIVLLLAAGCGPSGGLFLTLEANGPLRVGDDVDQAHVVFRSPDGATVWNEQDFNLDPAEHRFPLTLGVEVGPKTGERVWVGAWLRKGGVDVALADAVVPVVRGQMTEVTLRLTRP